MRVVIADDQPDVVVHLKEIIEELGHDAVGFTDGEAFSDSISREIFDLVIQNRRMLETETIECTQSITKNEQSIYFPIMPINDEKFSNKNSQAQDENSMNDENFSKKNEKAQKGGAQL